MASSKTALAKLPVSISDIILGFLTDITIALVFTTCLSSSVLLLFILGSLETRQLFRLPWHDQLNVILDKLVAIPLIYPCPVAFLSHLAVS